MLVPGDPKEDRIVLASKELKVLAALGYSMNQSIRMVSEKLQLRREEIFAVRKVMRWPDEALRNAIKKIPPWLVEERILRIDGYNVLQTIDALLSGEPVYLSTDGFLRDIRSSYRSPKRIHLERALNVLVSELSSLSPREVEIVFDSQISRSGELARKATEEISSVGLRGRGISEKSVDLYVSDAEVSASSDSVIISKAKAVVDLPELVLQRVGGRAIWI